MTTSTRCPACRTQFLVTPDLLALSQGWVRCGTCAEIFDASAHLQSAADASGPLLPETADTNPASSPPTERDYRQDAVFGVHPLPSANEPQDAADSHLRELQELDFIRQAQRQAVWHKPSVVAALVLVCLLLGSLLTLQISVHERDRLAALYPSARPALAALCTHLDCSLAPLRQIDAIVIDGSSFNKAPGDTYRFSLSIKNTSALELAMPAVELVLTDSQDQLLVRRVLLPTELGAPSVLSAQGEWSAALPMALKGDIRVAGYRALVFYP